VRLRKRGDSRDSDSQDLDVGAHCLVRMKWVLSGCETGSDCVVGDSEIIAKSYL